MSHFVLASAFPFALAFAGALGVEWAIWSALAYMMIGVPLADIALPRTLDPRIAQVDGEGLPLVLALLHLGLLPVVLHAMTGATGLDMAAQLGLFATAAAIFGQISAANAHELIHKRARIPNALGRIVYATMFFGHHASAHPAVHHRYVATPLDPNTARDGESLYAYLPRAWIGSLRAAWDFEAFRMGRQHLPLYWPKNPFWGYGLISCLTLLLGFAVGGWAGAAAVVVMGLLASAQLLASDYVQHYGLRRAALPGGGFEPVGPQHSWNAPAPMSRLMMLNAPLHAQHHLHPSLSFPELGDPDAAVGPELPYSLPVMAAIACVPPLWRRVMNRALTRAHLSCEVKPLERALRNARSA